MKQAIINGFIASITAIVVYLLLAVLLGSGLTYVILRVLHLNGWATNYFQRKSRGN